MQLLALTLYSLDGRRRNVEFEPGKLNIVTGESKTGKSALLTITEYCLGRSEYLVPAGPIANAVSWYATLWQLTADPAGPRAFAARPAPPKGQKTTQRMMFSLGGPDLRAPDFADLTENSDADTVQRLLGRAIGIDENFIQSRGPGMNQTPFQANLGHAAWLCFQDQDEVASKNYLFHRQGDGRVAEHLKDTIPYFLGAAPADAAAQRAAIRDAQRTLRRAETALANAQNEAYEMDSALRSLLAEARAVGLTEVTDAPDRTSLVTALHAAVGRPVTADDPDDGNAVARPGGSDAAPLGARGPSDGERPRDDGEDRSAQTEGQEAGDGPADEDAPPLSAETIALLEAQNRRRALLADRDRLSRELDNILDSRKVLLDRRDQVRDFTGAVAVHAGRLTSLELLELTSNTPEDAAGDGEGDGEGDTAGHAEDGAHEASCPFCGNDLPVPDASVTDLRDRLAQLRSDVADLGRPPGSIESAITDLESTADQVRAELAASNTALEAVTGAEELARRARNRAAAAFYTRGRISAYLSMSGATTTAAVNKLRNDVVSARTRLERLAAAFDPDNAREQLLSRLNLVGRYLTDYARRLGVEHVQDSVRLDLANLTVVTDTNDGPLALTRIGSGSNWIGYHLAAHLALHRYFVENDRPVPSFLMVDQPSQAFFPSEAAKATGKVKDADRDTVMNMFQVMKSVVDELAPRFQIIVSDHADLEEDWFQEAIKHTWRDGVKLVPLDWLDEDEDVQADEGEETVEAGHPQAQADEASSPEVETVEVGAEAEAEAEDA
jgi:hypothetical protein